jgi:hypothetical protein
MRCTHTLLHKPTSRERQEQDQRKERAGKGEVTGQVKYNRYTSREQGKEVELEQEQGKER